VAVGCDEGVWIGIRHDAKSLRKVLHVKAVTNIAVLEEFGIFLVLQDRVSEGHAVFEVAKLNYHQTLLAYHLEALVPSASSPQVRAAPQRLSPGKDVVFFSVGQLSGRTLVLYMKKKGVSDNDLGTWMLIIVFTRWTHCSECSNRFWDEMAKMPIDNEDRSVTCSVSVRNGSDYTKTSSYLLKRSMCTSSSTSWQWSAPEDSR
jgi:hypothetical protein